MEQSGNYNLPEASIALLKYLNDVGKATQKELNDILDLPLRKIRYAIRRLKEEQFIISKPDLLDMRSLKYEINQQMKEKIDQVINSPNTSLAS